MNVAPGAPWTAVILAAGEGRRMGGPKALLDWNGVPLAVAHARAALAQGAASVRVVVRAAVADALAPWIDAPHSSRVLLCLSDRPEADGPAGSLHVAAQHGATAPVAVCPVDVPPEAWACLPALLAALPGHDAARPVREGRGGHPVLLGAPVLRVYATGGAPPILRDALRAARTRDVPVELPAIRADLDTPADLAAWRPAS